MQQEKETVSQESHVFTRQQLASMTLPFILDSLSIMLNSMLIPALISSAGESSVAAVNLVSPIFTLIVCLMNGISAGGTVEIAQSYGSRDMERMNLAAGHILWMTFLSGTALSLVLAEWAVRMAALSIRLLRGSWWKGEKKEISVKENTL